MERGRAHILEVEAVLAVAAVIETIVAIVLLPWTTVASMTTTIESPGHVAGAGTSRMAPRRETTVAIAGGPGEITIITAMDTRTIATDPQIMVMGMGAIIGARLVLGASAGVRGDEERCSNRIRTLTAFAFWPHKRPYSYLPNYLPTYLLTG